MSAWTWSYHHNQEGLARAADTSAKARTALGGVGAPRDGDLSSLAEALSAMRRIAPSVNDPVKDAPWSMSFGLYQARKVEAQVDERYRMALQQGLGRRPIGGAPQIFHIEAGAGGRQLAHGAPEHGGIVQVVQQVLRDHRIEGVRFERRAFHALFATADQKEGMAAFVEKRPAKFKHR